MPIDEHGFRLPSLGEFLGWAVTSVGGIPTEAKRGSAPRRAAQRLVAGGNIDPSGTTKYFNTSQGATAGFLITVLLAALPGMACCAIV